jgi:hypothetical protein
MFAINITASAVPKGQLPSGINNAIVGEIQINDFVESITISIDNWTVDTYIKQWVDAVSKLLITDNAKSVLVTDFLGKANTLYIAEFWPLYREGEYVYIQNYFPSRKDLPSLESLDDIYNSVQDRPLGVSEWRIKMSDLQSWASGLIA